MEDINLHFTGDFHAITSANNLLCAMLDNHIYQGNELNIDKDTICIKRILDMNDRVLRNIKIDLGSGIERNDSFEITVASEVMAIFCLCKNLEELNYKLGNIIVGYTYDKKAVYAKDLKANEAMTVLLKDTIKPNLIQTLENTPCIMHGGPFANIAHGCNSIIATKLSMKLCEYTVTEAGFGADLGAEKFLNIKCKKLGSTPDVIVLTATIRAIKYNGGCLKEEFSKESLELLSKGICNLERHIDNLLYYGKPVIVVLNKFNTDTNKEIEYVKKIVNSKNVECIVSSAYEKGSLGNLELAEKVVNLSNNENKFKPLYNDNMSIKEKIEILAVKTYGASSVKYSDKALEKIEALEKMSKDKLPICMAKTQTSFSSKSELLGAPVNYEFNVTDIKLCNGAGFIVVYAGDILTMPGLPKVPSAENIKVDNLGNVLGIH